MSAALTSRTIGGLPVIPVAARSRFLNIFIYGESGVGKTTLAGSAAEVPEMNPVLVIDFEGGTESLVRTYPQVEQVRVTTWKQMQLVYDELLRGNTGINTVVIDSLTEVQKFSMYQIMAELMVARPDLDPDVPSVREWGKNLEQVRRMVRGFRDLQMNTIFTALKQDKKNDSNGRTYTKPSLSGKMCDEIAGFLDIVAYYYVKRVAVQGSEGEDKRLLLTAATETVTAKDRTGKLPMLIESPTMKEILEYTQVDDAASKDEVADLVNA